MKLVPLEDRIVVRTAEAEETTVSGLVIPDTAKEKPQQGEVLAVGPGRRAEDSGELIPLDIAVGDTVVYSKYGGTEITVDGEDLLILAGRDVLAKVALDRQGQEEVVHLPHPPFTFLATTAPPGAASWRVRTPVSGHGPLADATGRPVP